MIYKSTIGDIDLSKLVRLYPAAVVNVNGSIAEMSLEWSDMNKDKVDITSYALIFDFTPPKEEIRNKKELHFKTKEQLMTVMAEVAQLFGD